MERVTKIYHKGKEIIFVDYSNVKIESEMIAIFNAQKEMVLKDRKKYLFCADFTGSYSPPEFMKEIEKGLTEAKDLIIKGSFFGVTGSKSVLINGLIKSFNVNFKTFDDKNSALDFLVL
jgi:hypothetical protein